MKTTLIKTDNNLILCSEEEIKTSDWVLDNQLHSIPNSIFQIQVNEHTIFTNRKKVIAQLPNIKLSDEVAKEIGWIDIEELWEQFRIENPNTVGGFKEQYESFKWCFQKHQELNQKKYSESDLRKAIELARDIKDDSAHDTFTAEDISGCTEVCTYGWRNKYSDNEIIQSLSKSQWEVEVELIDGIYHVNKIIK